jgi:SPP1 gp7 family putative phage head morphogenesis protein
VIIKGLAPDGSLKQLPELLKALTDYAKLITPWSKSVATLMLADVYRRDSSMWRMHSKAMGKELRHQLLTAPVGDELRQLEATQVELIKSIPLDAAKRVHELSMETLVSSARAKEIAREIMNTEGVSKAKATLIARTEVSRASSNLVEVRSKAAGSEGYTWRTSGDDDVRDSHKAMEGKYVRWTHPPTLDNMVGHAGCFPNCRCFAEPIFPND